MTTNFHFSVNYPFKSNIIILSYKRELSEPKTLTKSYTHDANFLFLHKTSSVSKNSPYTVHFQCPEGHDVKHVMSNAAQGLFPLLTFISGVFTS